MTESLAPAVVLVRPRNPLNIGAAARAMANFGLSDLRIVSPHPPIWEEARRSAVDAGAVLRDARVYATLAEATADRRLVLAASCLRGRAPDLEVRLLPRLRRAAGQAVVFGPEKGGLSGEDLRVCDVFLRIPTVSECPSLNLGQAVALVCFQWVCAGGRALREEPRSGRAAARRITSGELELLVDRLECAFAKLRYRPALTPDERRGKVRRLLRLRGVAPGEAGMFYEVLRRYLD